MVKFTISSTTCKMYHHNQSEEFKQIRSLLIAFQKGEANQAIAKMTRSKVQLSLVDNGTSRKSSLKKRKRGLIKKVHELSTLCGAECCVSIYGPHRPMPYVWTLALGAQQVIAIFRGRPQEDQKNGGSGKFLHTRAGQGQKTIEEYSKRKSAQGACYLGKEYEQDKMGQSLDDNDLTRTNESVLKPQLEEMEKRIVLFNQTAAA